MGTRFFLLSVMLMSALLISLGQGQFQDQDLSDQDLLFNCDRYDQDCKNGGSCNSGACDCTGDYTGIACQYENKDPCALSCGSSGTCVDDTAGNTTCSCPSIYKGDDCSEDRIVVECQGVSFLVNVSMDGLTTSGDFGGLVYLGNNNSDIDCHIDNVGSGVFSQEWVLETFNCSGRRELVNDTTNGIVGYNYEAQLTIQFSPYYIDVNDVTVNLTCFVSDDDQVSVSAGLNVEAGGLIKDAEDAIAVLYDPVTLRILDVNNNDLTEGNTDAIVGDWVTLETKLTELSVYSELAVDECLVEDKDAAMSLAIIDNRCVTDDAKKIMNPGSTNSSTDWFTHEFELRVFKLTDSTRTLTFTCDVILCKAENDTRCDISQCDNKRRRRSAVNGLEVLDHEKKEATITIGYAEEVIITSEGFDNNCETSESTQISLISLAVVAVLLLVVCITLAYFLISSRNAKFFQL